MKPGKVYLVGAGPGDPGLITRRGIECLMQTEVIVYDHLLNEQLLDYAPPEAERIYVGKTSAEHTLEQTEINQLLVARAKAGKIVVRLKGGDPFVLGRGGEEAEVLADNHIPFEIVPGISAAVAVPAYAAIPVTHRGLASSFAVITGHTDLNRLDPNIAWDKLSTGVDTLVFLMGMKNLHLIVDKLLQSGRKPDTPIAIIKDGTQPEQKTVIGTLNDIVDKANRQNLEPPAVIIVGEVVRLRDKLRWFDNRPLFGRHILVTRARHQASILSKLLAEKGAHPIEFSAIEIQRLQDNNELDNAILRLTQYQWIVFTSVNGVEAFFERLHSLKFDSRKLHSIKIGVIGPATAKALEHEGIVPDYCPPVYTTEGLAFGFRNWDMRGQRLLLLRASIADEALSSGLTQLGADVNAITAYKTASPIYTLNNTNIKGLLESGNIDMITFTSSSTVSNLLTAVGDKKVISENIKIACIGPKTAATAAGYGIRIHITAREHTIPGLVAAIEEYYTKEKN